MRTIQLALLAVTVLGRIDTLHAQQSASGTSAPAALTADGIRSDIQFIRTKDKILLMRAPNMVVTGELSAE